MKTNVSSIAFGLCFTLGSSLFAADEVKIPCNFDVENRGADCEIAEVKFDPNQKLPDPFEWADKSGRIANSMDWICRRNEIKAEVEKYEIGPKPEKPEVSAQYSGGKLKVTVTVNGNSIDLTCTVSVPSGNGPFPVAVSMGGSADFSGAVKVNYDYNQVVNLNYNGQKNQNDPFYKVYPDLWGKVANYSAWPWGASRIIDGLELVKDDLNLDLTRIAVIGCSSAGKMALYTGALDERITLTIAQESGGGGIPGWRVPKKLGQSGYNCEKIDNTNYSWFLQSMSKLDPYDLPHDHHELIAMVAPRAFLALGNENYNTWLCDQGGIISCMAAHEVWKAMGVEDRFGYDFAGSHPHCQASSSQTQACNAFIDKFLRNKEDTDTKILRAPPNVRENIENWVDWETPTIEYTTTPVIFKSERSITDVSGINCLFNALRSEFIIEANGNFSYMMVNQAGKVLATGSGFNKTSISRRYPNGVYFFKVNHNAVSKTVKLVTSQ